MYVHNINVSNTKWHVLLLTKSSRENLIEHQKLQLQFLSTHHVSKTINLNNSLYQNNLSNTPLAAKKNMHFFKQRCCCQCN